MALADILNDTVNVYTRDTVTDTWEGPSPRNVAAKIVPVVADGSRSRVDLIQIGVTHQGFVPGGTAVSQGQRIKSANRGKEYTVRSVMDFSDQGLPEDVMQLDLALVESVIT
jgi:hypothetical protein